MNSLVTLLSIVLFFVFFFFLLDGVRYLPQYITQITARCSPDHVVLA